MSISKEDLAFLSYRIYNKAGEVKIAPGGCWYWGRFLILLLAAGGLAGCKKYVPPKIQWKSDPGERYEVYLQLDSWAVRNATSISGIAQYSVSNFTECMATDRRAGLGGLSHEPFRIVNLNVRRVGSNAFITSAYKNPLVDENYYGLGICKWMLRSIDISFDGLFGKVTAAVGDVSVRPGKWDLLCNETTGFCSLARYIHEPARMRARFTKGYVVIK